MFVPIPTLGKSLHTLQKQQNLHVCAHWVGEKKKKPHFYTDHFPLPFLNSFLHSQFDMLVYACVIYLPIYKHTLHEVFMALDKYKGFSSSCDLAKQVENSYYPFYSQVTEAQSGGESKILYIIQIQQTYPTKLVAEDYALHPPLISERLSSKPSKSLRYTEINVANIYQLWTPLLSGPTYVPYIPEHKQENLKVEQVQVQTPNEYKYSCFDSTTFLCYIYIYTHRNSFTHAHTMCYSPRSQAVACGSHQEYADSVPPPS